MSPINMNIHISAAPTSFNGHESPPCLLQSCFHGIPHTSHLHLFIIPQSRFNAYDPTFASVSHAVIATHFSGLHIVIPLTLRRDDRLSLFRRTSAHHLFPDPSVRVCSRMDADTSIFATIHEKLLLPMARKDGNLVNGSTGISVLMGLLGLCHLSPSYFTSITTVTSNHLLTLRHSVTTRRTRHHLSQLVAACHDWSIRHHSPRHVSPPLVTAIICRSPQLVTICHHSSPLPTSPHLTVRVSHQINHLTTHPLVHPAPHPTTRHN